MAEMSNPQVALLAAAQSREWAPFNYWDQEVRRIAEENLRWLEEQDAKISD